MLYSHWQVRNQWGKNKSSAAGESTVTFPIAFTTACYAVVTTVIYANIIAYTNNITKNTFDIATADYDAHWIALGK